MFVSRGGPRYSEKQARDAIAASLSYTDALRRLGMRPAGGNHSTLRKYANSWQIPTEHFDSAGVIRAALRARAFRPLAEVMVVASSYSRKDLKRRLFKEGLKPRACEMCGQGEIWHGRDMSLILDHINGVADDHRLENLRVVCPNCAATLETHCGRNNRCPIADRACRGCGRQFTPNFARQQYCSRDCGQRARTTFQQQRRDTRPSYAQLKREVSVLGYSATGRRYGVSDNAIRKWLRQYEREQRGESGRSPAASPGG